MEKLNNLPNDQVASKWQCQELNLSGLATEAGSLNAILSSLTHRSIHQMHSQKYVEKYTRQKARSPARKEDFLQDSCEADPCVSGPSKRPQ